VLHPATEKCNATSKRSGRQCQRLVIGGGPCPMHGGNAPQVKARREQRILLAEAKAKALPAVIEPQEEPTADELLISLLTDVRSTLLQIKASLADNPSPTWLVLLGDGLDRADRISRSVIITGAQERVEQRKVAVCEEQSWVMATSCRRTTSRVGLGTTSRVGLGRVIMSWVHLRRRG
jgi:hypothetical protein